MTPLSYPGARRRRRLGARHGRPHSRTGDARVRQLPASAEPEPLLVGSLRPARQAVRRAMVVVVVAGAAAAAISVVANGGQRLADGRAAGGRLAAGLALVAALRLL